MMSPSVRFYYGVRAGWQALGSVPVIVGSFKRPGDERDDFLTATEVHLVNLLWAMRRNETPPPGKTVGGNASQNICRRYSVVAFRASGIATTTIIHHHFV